MAATKQIIEAEWTWTGEQFQRDTQVTVDRDGRIARIGPNHRPPTHRLPAQALLPGFVNAHSHAFQRGLRGNGESFPVGSGTFWTWRDAMYDLVLTIDATTLYHLTSQAFMEMRAAGITTVGEFHQFHHTLGQTDYAYDAIILKAAANAGIRIALLDAYYRKGGVGQPLNEAQRRFESTSPAPFWKQIDALERELDTRTQSLGVVAHSIRAVPIAEVAELHAESVRRGMVFHMHVEEQQHEIDQCLAAHQKRPMQLLLSKLAIDQRFTAVHATLTTREDLSRFLEDGGNVCLTPLTEANLGDGLPDIETLRGAMDHLSLGTDSNARISMLEEMRWLEYAHRLGTRTRGVLRDDNGRVAKRLLEIATRGGARSLGIETGRIYPGYWADFVAVDLNHPSLTGCNEQNFLEGIVFGASEEVITSTCVGGKWMEHRERRVR